MFCRTEIPGPPAGTGEKITFQGNKRQPARCTDLVSTARRLLYFQGDGSHFRPDKGLSFTYSFHFLSLQYPESVSFFYRLRKVSGQNGRIESRTENKFLIYKKHREMKKRSGKSVLFCFPWGNLKAGYELTG